MSLSCIWLQRCASRPYHSGVPHSIERELARQRQLTLDAVLRAHEVSSARPRWHAGEAGGSVQCIRDRLAPEELREAGRAHHLAEVAVQARTAVQAVRRRADQGRGTVVAILREERVEGFQPAVAIVVLGNSAEELALPAFPASANVYGNLHYKQRGVSLTAISSPEPIGIPSSWPPLAIESRALVISSVTLDGDVFRHYRARERELATPPRTGGSKSRLLPPSSATIASADVVAGPEETAR
jgi:hypothetical protein